MISYTWVKKNRNTTASAEDEEVVASEQNVWKCLEVQNDSYISRNQQCDVDVPKANVA